MRLNTEPIKVGEQAPDFTLTDEAGTTITLSKLKQSVVLVFYRGYWWPYCARQLAELRTLKQTDDKFILIAITIDSAERSQGLRKKIAKDGKGEINFPLLSDPGHKIIDDYGLYDPAYAGKGFDGIPHPAVYVIDKKGKIAWAKVESDYRLRPTNEEIRTELAKLK